jgi:hypothetical protein
MRKSTKFYLFLTAFTSFFIVTHSQSMDFVNYVAGSQTGIPQTVGAAVGTVAGPVATRILAVDMEEMQGCLIKQKNLTPGLIDLNDPCNKWTAFINREEYDYNKFVANIPPSIIGIGMLSESTYKEIPKGILMNNAYYASDTFKNVPILKSAFASTGVPVNEILVNIKNTWELTRNLAFMILLVAALITGITIMTSKALSGKDSDAKIITAEKALPRVILAVILISSSYWIGELTLNALVGSGIVQGIAKFLAESLIPASGYKEYLDFPLASLLFFLLGSLMILNIPVIGLVFIATLIFFALVYVRLNIYIFRNVVFTMLYIIFAPFVLAQGALPGDMSGNAFKKYAYQLVYFIASGFIFALILYATNAIIAIGLPNFNSDIKNPTFDGAGQAGVGGAIVGAAGGFFSGILQFFFFPIIAIMILDQATKVHGLASSFASRVTGVNEGFGLLSAGGAASGGSKS